MVRLTTLIIALLFPAVLFGYETDGNRWEKGVATFYVDIPGVAPSGISWNTAFEDAMAQWSEETAFNFLINNQYLDPCEGFSASPPGNDQLFPEGDGDLLNGTDFSETVCGNEFGTGVIGLTLTISESGLLGFGHIAQTDILFNANEKWDIYTGPRRSAVDFGRVALHELGHALGLGHENSELSIMSPRIGEITDLQPDDIAGANALYGGPGNCTIRNIDIDTVVLDSLQSGDCTVLELFNGGVDSSYVDTYRLVLEEEKDLILLMESAGMDSVLIVATEKLEIVELDDDSAGNCNAVIKSRFPAGEYLILANTYDEPNKCGNNRGKYKISITENSLPILSNTRSTSGAASKSIFNGGASSDGGASYKSKFLSTEVIDVVGNIKPDPDHLNQQGTLYILVVLSNGQMYAKDNLGKFVELKDLKFLPVYKQVQTLNNDEQLIVINDFVGREFNVDNLNFAIYFGYSTESNPAEIFFNGQPLVFDINGD